MIRDSLSEVDFIKQTKLNKSENFQKEIKDLENFLQVSICNINMSQSNTNTNTSLDVNTKLIPYQF